MDNVVMLFACLIIGMLLRWTNRVPDNAPASINAFIIHVSLPALTLLQLHSIRVDPDLFYAVLMPWLLFVASALLFGLVGLVLALPHPTTGALAVVAGLGNTSFMGLPMIEAFYGREGMPTGIVIDQLGTYLVLSTIGIVLICFYAGERVSGREVGRRIISFPPLIALVVAVLLIPVDFPGWAASALGRLGATLAPLALVSVGLQLRFSALHGNRGPLAMGIGYKLVLGPLLLMLLYGFGLGLRGPTTQVTLFEAAMAPQVGGSIVAIQYGLNPQLISLMVGIGTVLSFITLPLWWHALQIFSLG